MPTDGPTGAAESTLAQSGRGTRVRAPSYWLRTFVFLTVFLSVASLALIAVSLRSVTPSYSTEERIQQFSIHKEAFYELDALFARLKDTVALHTMTVLSSGEARCVLHGQQRTSYEDLYAASTETDRTDLRRAMAIMDERQVWQVGLDEYGSLWITMDPGGVLGSDLGYVHLGETGPGFYPFVDYYTFVSHSWPIPGEENWFVFQT